MTPNSSLLQWLATFQLDSQPSVELKSDAYYNLADGYVFARILNQISPKNFPDQWLDGIKPVPPNGSWRLRVSNLRRILKQIYDYASDLQSTQFKPEAITPDVAVIAQNFDPDQISRLIQLILFCAINCDKKQDYVDIITNLPTQVKHDIKEAIEELLIAKSEKHRSSRLSNDLIDGENEADISTSSSQKITASSFQITANKRSSVTGSLWRESSQLSQDNSRRNESNLDLASQNNFEHDQENIDNIKQTCHDLELKLKQLQLEKDQLASENDRLINEKGLNKFGGLTKLAESRRISGRDEGERKKSENSENADVDNLILNQNNKLKMELQRLKSELIRVETEREDFRLKSNLLAEDLEKITLRRDELISKAEQAKRLQDELDEHKHISEKVINYETVMENLVKKNSEIKKELKSLEEKNISYIQKIVRLEEDNKELANTNSRIEVYRKQLHDAQIKLSQETHRADKAEIELNRLSEKYSAVKSENLKLYETTNQLIREGSVNNSKQKMFAVDKILSGIAGSESEIAEKQLVEDEPLQIKTTYDGMQVGNDILNSMSEPAVDLKEKLARLECENELLQGKLNSKRDHDDDQFVLRGLIQSANERCSELELENGKSRRRIILLESRLKELMSPKIGASSSGTSVSDHTLVLINRVEDLQRLLFQKEHELMDSETKYKRNLQKAKDVIKSLNSNQSISNSLHQSCMSSASPFNSNSLDETNLLKQQLRDREEKLIEMEREFYEFKRFKEIHERLIISAFYGLTTPIQWRNAEKRLERNTLTSPPNTASSSINHSKHSH